MGGLFGSKKPQPVARMPDEQDPAVLEARRRSASEQQARSGRTSTVMTTARQRQTPGQAGTTAYTNSLLGQA